MNDPEIFKDPEYGYPEVGILLEDTTNQIGKFYIGAITPFVEHDTIINKKDSTYKKSNIKSRNKDRLDIHECIVSNYIELHLPEYILEAKKGDKFVIGFINADLDKPFVIGRWYE